MGLDMYLNKKLYIGAEFEHRKVAGTIDLSINGNKLDVNFNRVCFITEEVGYWRKANHIHNWFVKNIQDGVDDCKIYELGIEDLEELLEICKKVKDSCTLVKKTIKTDTEEISLEVVKDSRIAEKLLPTTIGFCFGDTNYDKYYLDNVIYTIDLIEKLLKEIEKDSKNRNNITFEYSSSW